MNFRVDREGFFVALASIAACGAPSQPAPITVVSVVLPPEATPSATSEPIASAMPIASATPAPSAEGGPSNEGDGPTDEGGGPSYEGAMCRAKSAIKRPVACTDDRGAPGDCKRANCSLGFVCDQCEDYKRFFKPKIAERAVACVVGQTKRQAQDGCRTYQCGDEALKSACLDPTADAPCKSIAVKCKTSVAECRELLSGMNPAGRAKLASSVAKDCSYGLWSAIEGM